MQSSGLHAGIIMDGNGRWASARGLPRTAGHRAGARAVRSTIEAAPAAGISVLTLYAFSSDNWSRPMPEVAALMKLFAAFLRDERDHAVRDGVSVEVIGRRDRLPVAVLDEVARTEAATASGTALRLRLAVDYSAREAILRAAHLAADDPGPVDRERFGELLDRGSHGRGGVPPVDLLIRTGGEQRLSDFLLWECAYAELFFRDVLWPDFTAADLGLVVREFQGRERRFGGVAAPAASRAHLRLTR